MAICLSVIIIAGCPQPQNMAKKENNTSNAWPTETAGVLKVAVSIPPQKELIEQIGADKVHVISMLNPGDDLFAAKPSANNLALLEKADVFIAIGAGFENQLTLPQSIRVVNMSSGLQLKPFSSQTRYLNDKKDFRKDPYFWMSPSMVVTSLSGSYLALRDNLPDSKDLLSQNFTRLVRKLNSLEGDINRILMNCSGAEVYTDLPALGYFSKDFNIKQAYFVNEEGKGLNDLARSAITDKVHTIFFGPYMPTGVKGKLEDLIKGTVAQLDPLAEDYFANLISVAENIRSGQSKR